MMNIVLDLIILLGGAWVCAVLSFWTVALLDGVEGLGDAFDAALCAAVCWIVVIVVWWNL